MKRMGITTQQMREAPSGALYVWCDAHLVYPRDLAAALGRHDLTIVSPSWLYPRNFRGMTVDVVVDHSARLRLDALQWDAVRHLRDRVKLANVGKEDTQ